MSDDIRDAADLARFIGRWAVEMELPGTPPLAGWATFEWLLGHRFVVQRTGADHPDAPESHSILAADTRRGAGYVQHYFDSRGVVRTYVMDVDDPDWTLARTAPDFSPLDFAQRWTGRFSDDGRTITGRWETGTPEGTGWRLDFGLTYRRVDG
jgi:hypothetical protein